MTIPGKVICLFIVLVFSATLSTIASASSYAPSSAGVSVVPLQGQDMLNIPQPNQAGISIARFSQFSVVSRPLKIVNAFDQLAAVPTTIVIIAPNIIIENSVEVVGSAADVIFLSESAGTQISCVSCSFTNIYRLSFLIAEPSQALTVDSTELGEFETLSGGEVFISGLSAPGLMSLDILAESLNTAGSLLFHTQASKKASGGYEVQQGGRYQIGSNTLNAVLGFSTWNYDQNKIIGNSLSSTGSTIDGTIRTLGLKISTSAPLILRANINTKTDLVTTIRYRELPVISQEIVRVHNFSSAKLNVYSDITSSGLVELDSVQDLTLHSSSDINANQINLVAGKELKQNAYLTAQYIEIDADDFINEGPVSADDSVYAIAKGNIVNRYGGRIIGKTVKLQAISENSYILNGSRTPFISWYEAPLNVAPNYYQSLDATMLGAYYTAGLHLAGNFLDKQQPTYSSAKILGQNISIKANAFENINPYYQLVQEGESLTLSRQFLNQVGVVAEKTLLIDSATHILNSSAFLGAEREDSLVRMSANTIVNERYRLLSILDMDEQHNIEEQYDTGNVDVDIDRAVIETEIASYSPPGMMFSMGNFQAAADTQFINSVGYLEIFGDAIFSAPSLIDAGLAHKSLQKTNSVITYYGNYCSPCINEGESQIVTDPQQIDSLFYINGDAKLISAPGPVFTDLSPFNGYVNKAVADLIATEFAFVGQYDTVYDPGNAGGYVNHSTITFSHSVNGTVDWEAAEIDINWFEQVRYYSNGTPDGSPAGWKVDRTDETETFSLFQTLVNFLSKLAASIAALWSEINWWD